MSTTPVSHLFRDMTWMAQWGASTLAFRTVPADQSSRDRVGHFPVGQLRGFTGCRSRTRGQQIVRRQCFESSSSTSERFSTSEVFPSREVVPKNEIHQRSRIMVGKLLEVPQ